MNAGVGPSPCGGSRTVLTTARYFPAEEFLMLRLDGTSAAAQCQVLAGLALGEGRLGLAQLEAEGVIPDLFPWVA